MASPLPILIGVGLLFLVAGSASAAEPEAAPPALPKSPYAAGYALGYADGLAGKAKMTNPETTSAATSSGDPAAFAKGYAEGYVKGVADKAKGVVVPVKVTPSEPGCPPALKDGSGVLSTQDGSSCASPIKASNPIFQWTYTVQSGDSPRLITKKYLGLDYVHAKDPALTHSWDYAYCELIDANVPPESTVGERSNPNGRVKADGTVVPPYNFTSLMPGDVLKIPKSWNPWVSETGMPKGAAAPW